MRVVVRKQRGSKDMTDGQVKKVIRSLPPGDYMPNSLAAAVHMNSRAVERGLTEAVSTGEMVVNEPVVPDVSGYEEIKNLPEGQRVKVKKTRHRVYRKLG
jgi:hypothetical protein